MNGGSRPARARGLKLFLASGLRNIIGVAPRAGAWIETPPVVRVICLITSRPARARGLKRRKLFIGKTKRQVAPRAGRSQTQKIVLGSVTGQPTLKTGKTILSNSFLGYSQQTFYG